VFKHINSLWSQVEEVEEEDSQDTAEDESEEEGEDELTAILSTKEDEVDGFLQGSKYYVLYHFL
jgi:hypothetical protein